MSFRKHKAAFSLAELLISLTILGVMMAYTIPKVLTVQADQRKKAIFAETIAALNEIFTIGCIQGDITEANFGTYIISHLNVVKKCTNSWTQGCWFGTDLVGQSTTPGVVMHNGAVIAGLDDSVSSGTPPSGTDVIMIDWDGSNGNNLHGQDQLVLRAIINDNTVTDRVCSIRWDTMHTASQTLWLWIFS